jgi:carboxypeptidase family protein/photosynthesis system II assembly factor YCF48-like protein/putative zinc finger protein
MDQIAKIVSGRLKAQSAGPHPGPDLLAAFAENALQNEEREKLLEHVGACSDCRQILYLALPESAEAQRILSLKPNHRSALALRWGALLASLTVLAVILTARYQSRVPLMQKAISPPAQIAAEKVPADMDQIRAQPPEPRNEVPAKQRVLAEAKHMTAKPQANLNFDDSDQVRVSALPAVLPTLDQKKDLSVRSLPLQGRSVTALNAVTASGARPASPPPPVGGRDKEQNSLGSASSSPALLSPVSTVGGNLGGIISDPSGAAVANAKVTVIGPIGTQTVTSDLEGKFAFGRLPPGFYAIKAQASGFKPTEMKRVAVLDDRTSALRLMLDVGSASETVEVSAAAPAVDKPVAGSGGAPAVDSSTGFVTEGQQTAQLSLQKAVAANSRQRRVGLGSGAGVSRLLWTLSPEGGVQHSGDSGRTWQVVSVATGATFRALSAVGANIWVGGRAGTLYRSTDSGRTWVKVVPAAGGNKLDQDIVRLDFSDPVSGTINTANGEVWATSDGGQTWLRK